jgi:hypothetical protein
VCTSAIGDPVDVLLDRDGIMFDNTDGLPGPVIMKRFGNPTRGETEVRLGAVGPLVGELQVRHDR